MRVTGAHARLHSLGCTSAREERIVTVSGKRVLLLWDVDHTLIENSGVSKATYALAFEKLTGADPAVEPGTDGRTDLEIMRNLFTANDVDLTAHQEEQLGTVLVDSGHELAADLVARGHMCCRESRTRSGGSVSTRWWCNRC